MSQEVPSPDGRKKAVVFERSCGSTTGFSVHVALSRIQERLAHRNGPNGTPKQSPADILRERRRRRMEANGETYVEPPPVRLTGDVGRPLTIADVLRAARRERWLQTDQKAGGRCDARP